MSPESAPLTRTARASLVLRWAWIFRDRPQRNRVQIERTRFPVGGELSASPSRIPVLSLPDGPCDARRRIDLATGACGKIARLGRRTDPSPNAIHFDRAVRERLPCRSAENPTSPREQSWQYALRSGRRERSPHNCPPQSGRSLSPLTARTEPVPAIVAARQVQS